MMKSDLKKTDCCSSIPHAWVIVVMGVIALALSISSHVIEVATPADTVALQIVAWVTKALGLFAVTMCGVMVSTRLLPEYQREPKSRLALRWTVMVAACAVVICILQVLTVAGDVYGWWLL
ncbi:MAG: hypothetical protein AXW12_19770 [Thalassospira sp. Nap_22]|nr:MAG: hypothetical protein AXW12_19770 [Thalassospira sp. Nap_22]